MVTCPDTELLARHNRGDQRAFGELVRRHQDRAWAVAVRTLGSATEAEDAVQEAFLKALRSADRFRGEAAVGTWLHRIVVNTCLDRLRRAAARPQSALELVPEPVLPVGSDAYAAADTRLDVAAALARLPELQRVALVLVELEGLPVAAAAELLGVAEGTVKSRCSRGRDALATLLGIDRNADRPPDVKQGRAPIGENNQP